MWRSSRRHVFRLSDVILASYCVSSPVQCTMLAVLPDEATDDELNSRTKPLRWVFFGLKAVLRMWDGSHIAFSYIRLAPDTRGCFQNSVVTRVLQLHHHVRIRYFASCSASGAFRRLECSVLAHHFRNCFRKRLVKHAGRRIKLMICGNDVPSYFMFTYLLVLNSNKHCFAVDMNFWTHTLFFSLVHSKSQKSHHKALRSNCQQRSG